MKEHSPFSKNHLKKAWLAQMQDLWPAIKGSLALVRKPCVRKNCQACACGKKHPAWMLSVVARGKRSTRYVPQSLVGQIKRAIANGRKIEAELQKAAIQIVQNHRRQVQNATNPPPKS
jgi:hypothetical protein